MGKLAYVGIDVDDRAYHIGVVDGKGEIVSEFSTSPVPGKLAATLKKRLAGYDLKTCYEASYTGFTLHRALTEKGIDCSVIVPTSIPRSANERVKNDRIDAAKLAFLLSKDSPAVVAVPTTKQEADRSIVRSRARIIQQRSDLKRHILSLC